MDANQATFLLTGSMGCLGAWVMRNLVNQGAKIVATDIDTTVTRARLLLTEEELSTILWEKLDVTDGLAVNAMVEKHQPTHLIHLAGLQIPFCKANPSLGAAVNVVGTVNLFEAARHNNIRGLSYASSVGVLGAPELYPDRPLTDADLPKPNNLYGVYKTANEHTAKVYWQDWQVGSVGLRPYVVYGVCRDQGMTADIAKATLAVAADKPFHIRFDGPVTAQYADDVARIFIDCALAENQGADVFNLRNDVIEVAEYVAVLKQLYPNAQITFEKNNPLPFPADLDGAGLNGFLGKVPHTPLKRAIQSDVEQYEALLVAGKIDTESLNT